MAINTLVPIDFRLHRPDSNESFLFTLGQPADGQSLKLEFINRSRGTITIPQASGAPSITNYHLAVVFPPGLLLGNVSIVAQNGWKVERGEEANHDCYYFLRTGGDLTVPTGGNPAPQFVINGIRLSTALAWRHTTVVLRYNNLQLGGTPMPHGTRRLPLTILHTFPTDLSDLEDVTNVIDLRNDVVQLRDRLVPPLAATFRDRFSYWQPSGRERTVRINLGLNPKFAAVVGNTGIRMPMNTASFEIIPLARSGSDNISVEVNPGGETPSLFTIEHRAEGTGEKVIVRAVRRDWTFWRGWELPLNLTVDTGDGGMREMLVHCRGFYHNDVPLEDFTITLPFQLGPTEIGSAAGKNSRMVLHGESTDANGAGILQIRNEPGNDAPNLRFGIKQADGQGQGALSWIQAQGGKPLHINRNGNHVVIQERGGGGLGVRTLPESGNALEVKGRSVLHGNLTVNTLVVKENGGVSTARISSPGDMTLKTASKGRLYLKTNGNLVISNNINNDLGARARIIGVSGSPSSNGILRIDANSTANLRLGVLNSASKSYCWMQSHGNMPLHINRIHNNTTLNRDGGGVGIGRDAVSGYKLVVSGKSYFFELETEGVKIEKHAVKLGSKTRLTSTGLRIGNTTITEKDLKILRDLASGKLKVHIVSGHGYILDNYFGRVADGDNDRSVQFQRFTNSSTKSWKMTLKITS